MFYLSYLRSELIRRKGRTILTLLGLAIGVALVITISSLSRGLDDAQANALDPLSSIGTDLTVTLQPQQADTTTGFAGPGGGQFGGGGREVVQANQAAITDSAIAKLLLHGDPGAVIRAAEVAWCREFGASITIVDVGASTHFLPEDHPDEIATALCNWLDELT